MRKSSHSAQKSRWGEKANEAKQCMWDTPLAPSCARCLQQGQQPEANSKRDLSGQAKRFVGSGDSIVGVPLALKLGFLALVLIFVVIEKEASPIQNRTTRLMFNPIRCAIRRHATFHDSKGSIGIAPVSSNKPALGLRGRR